MNGTPLQTLSITTRSKVWKFPSFPFVQYDGDDESWARPLGFGREIEAITTITARGFFERREDKLVFRCVADLPLF